MFKKESLEEFFEKIGEIAKIPITLYLIGGGNMSLRNLKPTTKDIDIVLLNQKELLAFKEAVQQIGYAIDNELFQEAVYQDAVIVFKDKEGSRIDVFVKVICNQLRLSEEMIGRSTEHKTYGKVKLMLVSSEDIFLFKSLTDREQDINDCFVFVDAGLEWDIIIEECVAQHRDKVKWIFWLYEQICRIEEAKEIILPKKRAIFKVCRSNWDKRPSDFMLEFGVDLIKKHIPLPEQKEIIKAKKNET